MQVHDLLFASADRTPRAPYLWDRGEWWSFEAVAGRALAVARLLTEECGLRRGAHVALVSPNSADAVAAFFGVLAAGGVAVSLPTDLGADRLAALLNHSESQALIADRKTFARVRSAFAHTPGVRTVLALGDSRIGDGGGLPATAGTARVVTLSGEAATGSHLPVRTIDADLAAIIYTSGSTGTPKGVMLSHLNLVSNMRSIVTYLSLTGCDSVMMVLPHYYIYGLSLLLTHAMVGGSVVMDNRFAYPDTVLENMVETRVTGFAGVPSTFAMLAARSNLEQMTFPSLRYVTQAGGAMPVPLQKRVAAAFAPAELFVMYGATEAAPRLSYVEPAELRWKWGSIGRPVPNVDLYVADEAGKRLPPGTEGEIVARGSNIMQGYWRDPAGTEEVLRGGVYRTGDLGYEDEAGYFYITGRARDILKVRGFRVSPRDIEEVLAADSEVAEAAVVGTDDELLGEVPVAFVVPRDASPAFAELLAGRLRTAVEGRLPSYMVPKQVRCVPSLPHTSSGKVDKRALRDLLSTTNA